MYLYRDLDGNRIENATQIPEERYKIATDQNRNAYLITPSAVIYAATPGNGFALLTDRYLSAGVQEPGG